MKFFTQKHQKNLHHLWGLIPYHYTSRAKRRANLLTLTLVICSTSENLLRAPQKFIIE